MSHASLLTTQPWVILGLPVLDRSAPCWCRRKYSLVRSRTRTSAHAAAYDGPAASSSRIVASAQALPPSRTCGAARKQTLNLSSSSFSKSLRNGT